MARIQVFRAGHDHVARPLPPGAWVSRAAAILPFVFTAVVSVIAVAAGPGLRWLSMLAAAPSLAAARHGPRTVVAFGVFSIVLGVLLGERSGSPSVAFQAPVLSGVAVVTVVSAWLSALRQRRERELVAVRSVAEAAQEAILAPVPEEVGPLRLSVHYTAAATEATVGGDLYGVVQTPYGPRALVADVRGKGLQAVSTAALVLGVFREAAYDEPDLLRVVQRMEHSLRRNLEGDDFVTAVLTGFPCPGQLQIVNCGHVLPLLVHRRTVCALEPSSPVPPLGLLDLADVEPTLDTVDFAPGDRLLLYTDGVTEARDDTGTFFPLDEQLQKHCADPFDSTLDVLHEELLQHNGGRLDDDAALLLIERPGV